MIQKKVFENFVGDIERLLTDFEQILDANLAHESEIRLNEIKNKKVTDLKEEDYKRFIKKMGI